MFYSKRVFWFKKLNNIYIILTKLTLFQYFQHSSFINENTHRSKMIFCIGNVPFQTIRPKWSISIFIDMQTSLRSLPMFCLTFLSSRRFAFCPLNNLKKIKWGQGSTVAQTKPFQHRQTTSRQLCRENVKMSVFMFLFCKGHLACLH